jgi:hypothetical protein
MEKVMGGGGGAVVRILTKKNSFQKKSFSFFIGFQRTRAQREGGEKMERTDECRCVMRVTHKEGVDDALTLDAWRSLINTAFGWQPPHGKRSWTEHRLVLKAPGTGTGKQTSTVYEQRVVLHFKRVPRDRITHLKEIQTVWARRAVTLVLYWYFGPIHAGVNDARQPPPPSPPAAAVAVVATGRSDFHPSWRPPPRVLKHAATVPTAEQEVPPAPPPSPSLPPPPQEAESPPFLRRRLNIFIQITSRADSL